MRLQESHVSFAQAKAFRRVFSGDSEVSSSTTYTHSLLTTHWKANLGREPSLKLHLKGCAFPAREDIWLQYVILLDRTAAGFDRQYLSRAARLSLYRAAASRHKAMWGSGTCRHPSIHPCQHLCSGPGGKGRLTQLLASQEEGSNEHNIAPNIPNSQHTGQEVKLNNGNLIHCVTYLVTSLHCNEHWK